MTERKPRVTDHDRLRSIISRVISKYDLYGLSKGGAPEDEFESEILQISSALASCSTGEELKRRICRIFLESFGNDLESSSRSFSKMAEEILHLWHDET